MTKANFNLDKFRSTVFSQSLARTNRFEVFVVPPRGLGSFQYGELVSLLVEQASFPMLNIATKPLKIFGPTYQRPFTSEYGGEGMPITFHVDGDMKIRRFFEEWMHLIVDPINFTVGYQEQYATNILIRQLDEQNNVVYEIELLEAFPRNMNLMELNNAASNQTHRLNILFAYRYWKAFDPLTPVDIPRAITVPEIPTVDVRLPQTGALFNNFTFIGQQDEYGNVSDVTGP